MKNVDGDWTVRDTHGRDINFNFCHYAEDECGDSTDAFAFMKEGHNKCLALTSSEPKAEIAQAVERDDPKDKTKVQEGIRITRAGGSDCPTDSGVPLSVIFDVWCDPTALGEPS